MSDFQGATYITGHGEGPTLALVAGVHGDEVEPIAALEDWIAEAQIDRGRVIALPVAHAAALEANSRLGVEGADMNRSALGDLGEKVAAPGPTGQLANALVNWLADEADYVITLHSWSRSGLTLSYVEYSPSGGGSEVAATSRALAHALGLSWIEAIDWHPGLVPAALNRRGIPAVEVEVGGLGRTTPEGSEQIRRLLNRALLHLNLRGGEAPAERSGIEVTRRELAAPLDGRVRQIRALGEQVESGDVVAEIRAHDGSCLAEVTAPEPGLVAVHCSYGFVRSGEVVSILFRESEGR